MMLPFIFILSLLSTSSCTIIASLHGSSSSISQHQPIHLDLSSSQLTSSTPQYFSVKWGDGTTSSCSSSLHLSHIYVTHGTFTVTVHSSDDPNSCIANLDHSLGEMKSFEVNVGRSLFCNYVEVYSENQKPIFFFSLNESSIFYLKIVSYQDENFSLAYFDRGLHFNITPVGVQSNLIGFDHDLESWIFELSPLPTRQMSTEFNQEMIDDDSIRKVSDGGKYFQISIENSLVEFNSCLVKSLTLEGQLTSNNDPEFLGSLLNSDHITSPIMSELGFKMICDPCQPRRCLGWFSSYNVMLTFDGFSNHFLIDLTRNQDTSSKYSICHGLSELMCENLVVFDIKLLNGFNRILFKCNFGIVIGIYNLESGRFVFKWFTNVPDERFEEALNEGTELKISTFEIFGGFGCGFFGYNYGKNHIFLITHDSSENFNIIASIKSDSSNLINIPYAIRVSTYNIVRAVKSILRGFVVGCNILLLSNEANQMADVVLNYDGATEFEVEEFEYLPHTRSEFDPNSGWFTSVFKFPEEEVINELIIDPKGTGIFAIGNHSIWYSFLTFNNLKFSLLYSSEEEIITKFSTCHNGKWAAFVGNSNIAMGEVPFVSYVTSPLTRRAHLISFDDNIEIFSHLQFSTSCELEVVTFMLEKGSPIKISKIRPIYSNIANTFKISLPSDLTPTSMSSVSWLVLSSFPNIEDSTKFWQSVTTSHSLTTSFGVSGRLRSINQINNQILMEWPMKIPEFPVNNCETLLHSDDFVIENGFFVLMPNQTSHFTIDSDCLPFTLSDLGKSIVIQDFSGKLTRHKLSGSAYISKILTDFEVEITVVSQLKTESLSLSNSTWTMIDLRAYNSIKPAVGQSATVTNSGNSQFEFDFEINSGLFKFKSAFIGLYLFNNNELLGRVEEILSDYHLKFRSFEPLTVTSLSEYDWSISDLSSVERDTYERKFHTFITLAPCPFTKVEIPNENHLYIDRQEELVLKFNFHPTENDLYRNVLSTNSISPLLVSQSNPLMSSIQIFSSRAHESSEVNGPLSSELKISGKNDTFGPFSIMITSPSHSISCPFTGHYSVPLASVCPPFRLVKINHDFDLLDSIDDTSVLEPLPVNYRPPSRYGKGIPVCDNIYNADPNKPRYFDVDKRSLESGSFKQCEEFSEKPNCGCQKEQKVSQLESESDCITKALRVFFNDGFEPKFQVVDQKIDVVLDENFDDPYYLVELNGRTDYCFIGDELSIDCLDFDQVKNHLVLPDERIIFAGDELFHFKAVFESNSFCNFETEFIIWVFEPPAEATVVWSTISITAVTIGTVLFVLYLFYFKIEGRRF
ncbi:hypothetical protein P9112_013973 [Eukaryota sp. TZLM1-RC]